MSIITKKSEACSDWPDIRCIVIGRIPQACDGNVTPLTIFGNTQRLHDMAATTILQQELKLLLSLRKHLGGVMHIFPHSDVDL